MCRGGPGHARPATAATAPASEGPSPSEPVPLEPFEAVTITTLVDNVVDVLVPDTGAARRSQRGMASVDARTMEEGLAWSSPVAEHGFSPLVDVRLLDGKGHRILFDTGVSSEGMAENMSRLDLSPGDVDIVVCSHSHFDHTTGPDGFIRRVGRANVPGLLHPDCWSRRRLTIPGREPFEYPTTSRRALLDAGFEILERQQPSFLCDGRYSSLVRSTAPPNSTTAHRVTRRYAMGGGNPIRWFSTIRPSCSTCGEGGW